MGSASPRALDTRRGLKARELRGYCGEVEEDVEDRVLRRQSRQRHILLGHVRQTGLGLPGPT